MFGNEIWNRFTFVLAPEASSTTTPFDLPRMS